MMEEFGVCVCVCVCVCVLGVGRFVQGLYGYGVLLFKLWIMQCPCAVCWQSSWSSLSEFSSETPCRWEQCRGHAQPRIHTARGNIVKNSPTFKQRGAIEL